MRKRLSFLGVGVLITAVAFFGIRKATRKQPELWVTFPDGTSARILAVTYGTNHVVGSPVGKLLARLPWLQTFLARGPGGFRNHLSEVRMMTTASPELLVWLDRRTNSTGTKTPTSGYCEGFLADGSNFVSGQGAYMNSYLPWSQWEPVHFTSFPRRSRQISFEVFYHDPTGHVSRCSSLPFENPLYRRYPDWTPERLPVTRQAGDVEVTLRGVETGHNNNMTQRSLPGGRSELFYGTERSDGRNQTVVDIQMRSLKSTNEVWKVTGVEISDAAGNVAANAGMSWSGEGASFAFMPSLWPGEKAWKLKLEIKREQGFAQSELFAFSQVPLGNMNGTNRIGWQTNINGITITLQEICRRPPNTNNSWSSDSMSAVKFVNSPLPKGVHFDLLSVVFEPGKTNRSESWQSSANERTYNFKEISLSATNAEFTFAVQTSRTVEFLVKPELPKPVAKDH